MTATLDIPALAELQSEVANLRQDIARLTELLEPPPELLTTQEAARLLKVKPATIRKWAREGRIPVHRIGKNMMFDRAELRP